MVSKAHAIEIVSLLITSVVLGYIGVVAGINLSRWIPHLILHLKVL